MRSRSLLSSLLVLLAACASTPLPEAKTLQDLKVANASAGPAPGLLCSGQPTPEQFPKLKQAGIDRVISLRAENESGTGWEERGAPLAGLEFVRFVIEGAEDLTPEKAKEFANLLGDGSRTLVACGSSNRVGALFAMKARFVDGKTADEALAIGKACGLSKLEPAVKEALSK